MGIFCFIKVDIKDNSKGQWGYFVFIKIEVKDYSKGQWGDFVFIKFDVKDYSKGTHKFLNIMNSKVVLAFY